MRLPFEGSDKTEALAAQLISMQEELSDNDWKPSKPAILPNTLVLAKGFRH